MNKQEEIREGIQAILIGSPDNDSPEKLSKEILSYLHSQGVVIKVDRELPIGYAEEMYILNRCCKAVEPLIEETTK